MVDDDAYRFPESSADRKFDIYVLSLCLALEAVCFDEIGVSWSRHFIPIFP